MNTGRILLALTVIATIFAGCGEPKPVTVHLDTAGITPRIDYTPLAQVLKAVVDKEGYVVLDKYPKEAPTLLKQLTLLAVTGPKATPALFPTKDDQLAYWLNARSAWLIYLVAQPDASRNVSYQFPLDGRVMTMAKIDAVLEATGGFSAVMAAPGISLRRAPLPQEPFTAQDIQQQIQKRFETFIDSDRFNIDILHQEIRFPPVIWRYRQDLIDDYHRKYGGPKDITLMTALLPWLTGSAERRLQNAIGYRCVESVGYGQLAITGELPKPEESGDTK